ncbi:hypothetical protein EVJ58_g5883 [Rhodofomes roseus]|nr:hypothetical protein EVJ58_g5883 [Rhodofomes roseus]
MLGHFTTVKDWDARTKLLHQVNRLHDNYLEYATKIKKDDPKSSELSTAPTRGYLRILSSAGQYQQLFDVFNAMDEEGPLAPDLTVHGAMLRAVCTRSPTSTSTPDAARAENAARAKLVWRQLLKYVERTPSARVDSYHIREMLFALSHGSPSDQIFAFDLVRDYLGLAKPGETPKEPIVQLEAHTFEEVLKLCNNSQKYRLTIHFFQQVSGSLEPTEKSIINWRHVEAVLNAHAALAMMTNDDGEASQALDTLLWVLKQWAVEGRPDRLQPTRDHFNYVLSCCQRSGNWAIAAHTFEVFTGYRAADFADGGADASGEQPHRDLPSGRPAETTMFFLSDLARTAYLSGDLAHMRHCLRIIRFIDPQWYYPHKEHSHHDDRIMMRNFVSLNDRRFYATRMAEDVVAMIDKVVSAVSEQERHTKEEDWSRTRQKAKLVVREARASTDTVTTPFLAMNPLGGERSLAATDSFVEYDMTVRRNASSRSTKR